MKNLQDREWLRSRFKDGDRPDGNQFSAWIDSSINQKSDGLYASEKRLGIGIEHPTTPLDILGDKDSGGLALRSSNGGNSHFQVAHPDSSQVNLGCQSGEKMALGHFQDGNSGFTEQLVIVREGMVGIGTPSPQEALEVNGSVKVAQHLLLGEATLYFKRGKLYLKADGKKYQLQMVRSSNSPTPLPRWLYWALIVFFIFVLFVILAGIILVICMDNS